jgi:hypothetical protein
MGTFITPAGLYMRQKARFAMVTLTMNQAHEQLAEGGYEDFRDQTKGSLKSDQLAAIGHPYKRRTGPLDIRALKGFVGLNENEVNKKTGKRYRRGSLQQVTNTGTVKDLPINIQTGRLRRGIRIVSRRIAGNRVFDLYSDAPHAAFALAVDGTKYVRPRGLLGPNGLLRIRHKVRHNALVEPVRRSQKTQ